MASDGSARRWYSKGVGRVVRALLAMPALGCAVWLFLRGGALAAIGGVLLTIVSLSLPLAALFQEPD